jgi:23S rRNA (guanosine2251-2'-O)-methyltransferase
MSNEQMREVYVFWECSQPLCRLRFPAPRDWPQSRVCPACKGTTAVCATPTNHTGSHVSRHPLPTTAPHLELLLDNIRSVYNVGSMWRTADGAGVRQIHLCGITASPPNGKLAKTALGAQDSVPWMAWPNALRCADYLRAQGFVLWAIEDSPTAVSLFPTAQHHPLPPRLALIVGNEVTGVDPDLLALCERTLFLPMQGSKSSLNVTIALGTAVYNLLFNA